MHKLFSSLRHLTLLALIFVTLLSCVQNNKPRPDQESAANTFTEASCYLSVKYIEFKTLRLYPVLLKQGVQSTENFLSLAEGLVDESIKITEKNSKENEDVAEVNKLFIQNNSQDTLLLLGGEVIKGGKQDRTIAKDVIVPPNGTVYDVDVFCVESGRWTYDDKKSNKNKIKFSAPAPMLKSSVRKQAVVANDQAKVWNKVSEANSKAMNSAPSGSYNAFEDNMEYKKKEKAYLIYFKSKIERQDDIVGLIAVTSNKVFAADIFATVSMLRQRLDLLLPSYINEAIVDGAPVNIKQEQVETYANHLLASESSQDNFLKKNGKLFKVGNRKIHISSY